MKCPTRVIAIAAVGVSLMCSTLAMAKKPPKPPGGGGSGDTPRYKIIELARRPGIAYAVNASGTCVGEITDVDGLSKPYAWYVSPAGDIVAVPLPRANGEGAELEGSARDINNDGIIVGGLDGGAVYWADSLSEPVFLPVPEDALSSSARAVNNNGVIVGYYSDTLHVIHPVAWGLRADGSVAGPVDMQAVPDCIGVPLDINDWQTVVGSQRVAPDDLHGEAWLWQLEWDGTTLSLTGNCPLTPFFAPGSYGYSEADKINNDRDICGRRNPGGWREAWFLDNVEGQLVEQPLPLLVDDRNYTSMNHEARALNNADPPRIVGEASSFPRDYGGGWYRSDIPVLWQGSKAVDLEKVSKSPTLSASPYMYHINDAGWIAGRAWTGETEIGSVPAVYIAQ
ncbi:MAG: hypothetical protein ACYTG0_38115 [Planctomycetota bacterium]|jgi:hypothetical protein